MTLLDEVASVSRLATACADTLRKTIKKSSKRYDKHYLVKKARELRKKFPHKGLLELMEQEIRSAMGELSKEILEGRYFREPLNLHREPKPDGGTRFIMIHHRFEEKIVEKSVYSVIAPLLRGLLDNGTSFCGVPADPQSKRKLGIFAAHKEMSDLLKTNSYWIVKADIEKFFDRLDRNKVRKSISDALSTDHSLQPFFNDWLNIKIQNPKSDYKVSTLGIPQGSCLSGLIANLYLVGFDKEHDLIEGVRLFRYADDLLFACETEIIAKKVQDAAQSYLDGIGLKFKESKFDSFSPGEEFSILGYFYDRHMVNVADDKIDKWISSLGEDFKRIGKVAYKIAKNKPLKKRDIDAMSDAQDRIWSKLIAYNSFVLPEKQLPNAYNKGVAHRQAQEKMIRYMKASVKGINRIVGDRLMYLPEFRKKNKMMWPYFVPRIARTFSIE